MEERRREGGRERWRRGEVREGWGRLNTQVMIAGVDLQ